MGAVQRAQVTIIGRGRRRMLRAGLYDDACGVADACVRGRAVPRWWLTRDCEAARLCCAELLFGLLCRGV